MSGPLDGATIGNLLPGALWSKWQDPVPGRKRLTSLKLPPLFAHIARKTLLGYAPWQ